MSRARGSSPAAFTDGSTCLKFDGHEPRLRPADSLRNLAQPANEQTQAASKNVIGFNFRFIARNSRFANMYRLEAAESGRIRQTRLCQSKLLANAESAEDAVKNIVGVDGASNLAEFVQSQPKLGSDQLFASSNGVKFACPAQRLFCEA